MSRIEMYVKENYKLICLNVVLFNSQVFLSQIRRCSFIIRSKQQNFFKSYTSGPHLGVLERLGDSEQIDSIRKVKFTFQHNLHPIEIVSDVLLWIIVILLDSNTTQCLMSQTGIHYLAKIYLEKIDWLKNL